MPIILRLRLRSPHALAEAFGTRKLTLYYFYTDDASVASASHYYPNQNSVGITVRENQLPCDEYLCFLFEVLNSEGEQRFHQLGDLAREGKISRSEYATEIMKQEFVAEKRLRDLMATFGLSEKEKKQSAYYGRFAFLPDDFDAALAYTRKISTKRDAFQYYEQWYDAQKQYDDSLKNATNAVPPANAR